MNERPFSGFVPADGPVSIEAIFDFPAQFIAYARRFKGCDVDIEIRRKRTKRSDRQNRAFWAALTPWAHDLGYEPDELKTELMGLLWGTTERTSPITGEVRLVPNKGRSSKLTTQEMGELMEFMAVKAAETGYVMELPDEFNARRKAEQKKSQKAA